MKRRIVQTTIEEDESRYINDMNEFNSSSDLITTTSSK